MSNPKHIYLAVFSILILFLLANMVFSSDAGAQITIKDDTGPGPAPGPSGSSGSSSTPRIALNFTSLNITPALHYATIQWKTTLPASIKVYLFNKTHDQVLQTFSFPAQTLSGSVTASTLVSDTDYGVYISALGDVDSITSKDYNFTTLPVIPNITEVGTKFINNDSANIFWKTDVFSDSIVYYRKKGTLEWQHVPPDSDISLVDAIKYFQVPPPMTIPKKLASGNGYLLDGAAELGGQMFLINSNAVLAYTDYSYHINSPSGQISDPKIASLAIVQSHYVKIWGLTNSTQYEYIVSSCADRCINSSINTFKTNFTEQMPYLQFITNPVNVPHGTSAVFSISAYGRNPGGAISSAIVTYSDGGTTKTLPLKFGGDPKSFVPGDFNTISVFSLTFSDSGPHSINVNVTDIYHDSTTATVTVTVGPKIHCTGTSTKYYPSDTSCTDKWPNDGQTNITYNNPIGECHLFEICSSDLDYLNADAESCCNGERVYSDQPTQNRGYGYNKNIACNMAINDTQSKGAISHLDVDSSMKYCKAAYLVRSIGTAAVYMKDYYRGEVCCSGDLMNCYYHSLFQAADPWPASNIKFNKLYCSFLNNTINGVSNFSQIPGWYNSDVDPSKNNNAIADIPTHASVNIMNTGTCVDYSATVTTALRKSGFKKNEILSMAAPGHLYNAVWLPGDGAYSFIDTVGNTGGDFFIGHGFYWKVQYYSYSHCDFNTTSCSNDAGMRNCPKLEGC